MAKWEAVKSLSCHIAVYMGLLDEPGAEMPLLRYLWLFSGWVLMYNDRAHMVQFLGDSVP
jgi:hypothetical protein